MTKSFIFILVILFGIQINAQVGIGTITPRGALEINSATNGFILPQVILTATNVSAPVVNPQTAGVPITGTLIYNTATAGAGTTAVTPGYYYWDGALWIRIATTDWSITGNSGTNAGTNFLGTIDAVDLRIKTAGADRWNISNVNSGQLQSYSLGTAALPTYSWQGDQNTGVFSPAADNLGFATNGTEKVRIDANGNVGVGTTLPTGFADFNSTTGGVVMPRVALTATNVAAPVLNPQGGVLPAGTVVYNTATAGVAPNNVGPGLYFWDATLLKWIAFAGSPGGLDWSLTGNSSTIPGTYGAPGVSYLGTSDANALHITTSGLPRMRISANGNVGIGVSSTVSTRLHVDSAAATDGTINATGIGSNSGSLIPTASIKNFATDYATGMIVNTDKAPSVVSPNIALRVSSGTTSYISPISQTNIGITSNATNLAFYGITEGTAATTRRAAEFRTNDAGVATDSDANDPMAYLAGYAAGVSVDGTNTRDVKYGGYFYGGNASAYAYVGARLGSPIAGNSNYKIIGPGTVSTIVASDKVNGSKKIMFAPEAPEVLFEDYGIGKLVNGSATINIDPIFARNIFVDEKHPLKVFIQLEGDCNGVFVTNKSKNNFTVKELNKGTSNVKFSWHIVGNRSDETEKNGEKTIYQSLRYPDAPGPLAPTKVESKMIKASKADSEGSK